MLIIICGKSASGKSEISNILQRDFNINRIITCTTRDIRPGEKQDIDYHFISQTEFKEKIDNDEFAEYAEYSNNRFYGTAKQDLITAALSNEPYCIILTPSGMRAVEKTIKDYCEKISYCDDDLLFKIYVDAPDGVRVKRYIDRIGDQSITSTQLSECFERVQRDFGMFLGIEKEVDYICDNSLNISADYAANNCYTSFLHKINFDIDIDDI